MTQTRENTLEKMARAIALEHFNKRRVRLSHPERPAHLASTEWRTFLPEARAALKVAEGGGIEPPQPEGCTL